MKFKYLIFILIIIFSISVVSANENITLTTHDMVKYYQNDTQFQCNLQDSSGPLKGEEINFNVNNQNYKKYTDDSGNAILNIDFNPGNYVITTTYQNITKTNNITVLSFILVDNLTGYFGGDPFEFKLLDKQGNPLANKTVIYAVNGTRLSCISNDTGICEIDNSIPIGVYDIAITYDNLTVVRTLDVLSLFKTSDLVKYYKNGSDFVVTILDSTGNPLPDEIVSFFVNGVYYKRISDSNGMAKLPINLMPGDYVITTAFDTSAVNNNIKVLPGIMSNDLVKYYKNESQFVVQIYDKQGRPAPNKEASFNINGVFYKKITDNDGIAKLNINLNPGNYIITTQSDDLIASNKITVLSRFIAEDVYTTSLDLKPFNVTLLNKDGTVMNNQEVTFNINGIFYSKTTNNDGVASLDLDYDVGQYIVTYMADGATGSNLYTVNFLNLTVFDWGSGGDVRENNVFKYYIPEGKIVDEVIEAAKSGTPMLTFKSGNGPTVFMTAGMHGNELPAQVAALNLINYLSNNKFDGTIYLIPIIRPIATAENVRDYHGERLNKLANVNGTISNNILNMYTLFDCDAGGDFHSTQPGSDPGCNVIMGSLSPTIGSALMVEGMVNITGFNAIIVPEAGDPYPGALEDEANLRGIPSVTCEVLSSHGVVTPGSDTLSLIEMKAFLEYNKIIGPNSVN